MLVLRDVRLLPTWIGAAAGLALFAVFGAPSGLLYGGYAGLVMASVLTGTPVEPTLLVKLITLGGMGLGVFASFFFFVVLGAFLGTLAGMPFAPLLRRWSETAAEKADSGVGEGRHEPAR
jgi:hypothetical protein